MTDATQVQQDLSNELDEVLLEAVRAQKGSPEPNAAIFNAAIARLKALGITKLVGSDTKAAELAKECGLEANVIKFPALSDEEPDAASGAV